MGILVVALFTVVFATFARRLSSTMVTAPMAFLAFGVVLSETGLIPHAGAEGALHLVAEIALILLLFLDAAQIDLRALRDRHVWPVRMLAFGLPLAILFGSLVGYVLLPGWPIAAVALVAAILAPTDAALGQAVVTNPIVPARVRRALTVESGINDGLALPAVLLFASLAAEIADQSGRNWVLFGAAQLVLRPLVGIAAGTIGGKVMLLAQRRGWSSQTFEGIGAVALAGTAYLAALEVGGNGFIAAFVAGLAFGHVVRGRCRFVYEFTESEGQLLSWAAFFLLGVALVPEALHHLDGPTLALILLSLFIVRPAAIWLSLVGTDASNTTRLFFGWFGPRGLATALFALLVVPQVGGDFAQPILMLAVNAVWISVLLHGLSAQPGARWFAARVAAMGECAETEPVTQSAKPLTTMISDQAMAEQRGTP